MVTILDCELVQTSWFRTRAEALGGAVWRDGGMLWTDGPDGVNVMFPDVLDTPALRRGVEHARVAGHCIVGAWLGLEVDTAPLAAAGFESGWSPWWMTADLSDVPRVSDARVHVEQITADHEMLGGDGSHMPEGAQVWFASANTGDPEQSAGRAWALVVGDLVGVFDMDVWPDHRRTGIGTALLCALCATASGAGAAHAVLNATPEGKLLYSRRGFRQIGEGITWWNHLSG